MCWLCIFCCVLYFTFYITKQTYFTNIIKKHNLINIFNLDLIFNLKIFHLEPLLMAHNRMSQRSINSCYSFLGLSIYLNAQINT